MTAPALNPPLPTRPRRAKVRREPTRAQAARALRRSAPRTTGATWTRGGLPGYPRASAGVPWSESLTSLFIVALLFVPLAVGHAARPWVPVAAGRALVVASYLLWARRVLVGEHYVAVRQVGRYHVATVDHVRHLELRPSQHGGVLCLHTDDGRCMRLRRAEVARPEIDAALRRCWPRGTRGPATRASSTCSTCRTRSRASGTATWRTPSSSPCPAPLSCASRPAPEGAWAGGRWDRYGAAPPCTRDEENPMTDTLTRPAVDVPLTQTDRCDRCGARAYVRATMPSGADLLFCGHHGNALRASLLVAGAALHDETGSLTAARESSAAA